MEMKNPPRKRFKLNHPLLQMIRQRTNRQNKNLLVLVLGETGSGKSTIGLRFCELINGSNFSMKDVCMNTFEFLQRINEAIVTGTALLYEELGVSADSAEWWSLQNKVLRYITQTFRTDNLVVFFTVPDDQLIDNKMKLMFHAIIETHHIDYAEGANYFRIYRIQRNRKTGKVYKKYFRFWVRGEDGHAKPYTFPMFKLHMPSPWINDNYEAKRKVFTDQLKEDMLSSLTTGRYKKFGRDMFKRKQKVKAKEDQTKYDLMARRLAGNIKHYTDAQGRPIMTKIRGDFGLGITNANQIWKAAKAYVSPGASA